MTSERTVLLVVRLLGATAICSVLGSILLLMSGHNAEVVLGVGGYGGTALGALASILARTESHAAPDSRLPTPDSAPLEVPDVPTH